MRAGVRSRSEHALARDTTRAPLGPTRSIRCIGTTSAANVLLIGPRSTIVAIAMRQEQEPRLVGAPGLDDTQSSASPPSSRPRSVRNGYVRRAKSKRSLMGPYPAPATEEKARILRAFSVHASSGVAGATGSVHGFAHAKDRAAGSVALRLAGSIRGRCGGCG